MVKTVLVTGSSGLVGNAIKSVADEKNYNFIYLTSKDCELTDYECVLNYFQTTKPDIIIHLAACVGGLFKNMAEKVKMFEENILINTHVVKAAHECGVQELVACLSTCVFPDNQELLDETMLHNGPPHHSNEGYAYAKRMMEVHCRLYTQNFGRRYFCIIPTNIYGPHDNFNLEDAHVIPALIHKCYLSNKNNTSFEVKGSGKPLRQFIYSLDLAKLIFILLEKDINENVIVSCSYEYSIKYCAEVINSHFNNSIIFNQTYADGQYSKTSDNLKLINILKKHDINFVFTPLNKGIEKTIEWFKNNYNTARK